MSDKIDWKPDGLTDSYATLHYDIAVGGKPLPFSANVWRRRCYAVESVELEAFVEDQAYDKSGMSWPERVGSHEVTLPTTTTDTDILRIARMMACQLAAVFGEVLALQERGNGNDSNDGNGSDDGSTTQEPNR